MAKIKSSTLTLLGLGCIGAGIAGVLAASYGGGGGALLLGGWLIQKDGIGNDKEENEMDDRGQPDNITGGKTESGAATNEQSDLASDILAEFTKNRSPPDESGFTARELQSLDDEAFTNLMDGLIITTLEDEGFNYSEIKTDQGPDGFIGHLDDVTAFLCSARPASSSDEAIRSVVQEIQSTLDAENVGADFVLCFTDSPIPEPWQREIFSQCRHLVVSQEQTRAALSGDHTK